jgi:uncharacterized protein YjeT (DUF2065 family)
MKWFLYAISLIWISIGCCTILYTGETRNVVKNIVKGIDHKILSILPFIMGILFILSASASRHSWLIRLIGLTAVIKGVFIFTNPKNFSDKVTDWYLSSLSDQTQRLYGIITLILGTAILSWIL